MDSRAIISKYGLVSITRNGKQGVQPTRGPKMSAMDVEYIKGHKDEIMSILAERKIATAAPKVSAADAAYDTVRTARARYDEAVRRDEGAAEIIAARDAYEAALSGWQQMYPEAAQALAELHSPINPPATDGWNL